MMKFICKKWTILLFVFVIMVALPVASYAIVNNGNDVCNNFVDKLSTFGYERQNSSYCGLNDIKYDETTETLVVRLQTPSTTAGLKSGKMTDVVEKEMIWQKNVLNAAFSEDFEDKINNIEWSMVDDKQVVVTSGVYRDIQKKSEDFDFSDAKAALQTRNAKASAFTIITDIAREKGFQISEIHEDNASENYLCYVVSMKYDGSADNDTLNSGIHGLLLDIREMNTQKSLVPQILLEIEYRGKNSVVVWADYVHDWYISKQTEDISGCWGHSVPS